MKTIRTILKAACLAMIAASCTNEIDNSAVVGSGQLFEASFAESEPQTRVVIDSDLKKVSWEFSDEIGIFDAGYTSSVKATVASMEDGGAKAVFSPVTAVVNPTYAIHPYLASATADGDAITVTVSATPAGSFGESCIAVAKADDGKFAFKTVSAIFQFTVSDLAVKSVVIKGTGIAGDIKATVDGTGNVTVAPAGTPADEITVAVEPDQVCYVAVVPKEYSGLTFTYKDKDGNELGKTTCTDKMTVSSGDLLTWGDFAKLQKAYLPKGSDFNDALKIVAGGVDNIKSIAFMTSYKPAGTVINDGTEGAPIGVEFSSGTVFVCTPANEFVANADMSNMFSVMTKLESISGFNKIETSSVTDMGWLFECCHSLKSIDLSHFNTSNVTEMNSMFCECRSITNLDVSMFNTSKVVTMNSMFSGMDALTTLDLSNFNTSNVTTMNYGIESCPKLSQLTLGPDFKIPGSQTEDLFLYLGTDNSKPYTTFYCNTDQWKKISEQIGATDIVNYKWGNAPAAANLPKGQDFNAALKAAAGGSLTNIKTITFETLSGKMGTLINSGLGDTPVYVSYSSGAITVSTPAEGFNANADCKEMFYLMNKLTAINNLASVNTSEVTSMSSMFNRCISLASIDLSNFMTANVKTMFGMFYENNALTSLDLSTFNTSKVTDMASMFYGCKKLTSLDLSKFNTANNSRTSYMFRYCESLKSLDLSSFNTVKVGEMQLMFDGCTSLTGITLGSGFTTANVTTMQAMFRDCNALTSLDLSKFNTARVTNMHAMFKNCKVLTSLDLSSFDTAKVTDMDSLFSASIKLATITLGSGFTFASSTSKMFVDLGTGNSKPYTTFYCDVTQWNKINDIIGATDIVNYKWGNEPAAAQLPKGSDFNAALKTAADGDLGNITSIKFESSSAQTGTQINSGLGTTPVYVSYSSGAVTVSTPAGSFLANTNCSNMFMSCKNVTSIDFGNFDTSNVTNMQRMFYGCHNLASPDFSKFDTSKVTDMTQMFSNCRGIQTLDLSSFNTANVKSMHGMFFFTNKLTTLTLGDKFSTANVTSMGSMFGYSELSSIDLSKFNTAKVTDMSSMFADASKLTSLDLSSFDTSKVTEMTNMFSGTSALATLKLGSGFVYAASTTTMFSNMGKSSSTSGSGIYTTVDCNYDQWVGLCGITGTSSKYYKWKNAPAQAPLPEGNDFNTAVKTAAGGYSNVKTITFTSNSSMSDGTLVSTGTSPVYINCTDGNVTICTPSSEFSTTSCQNYFNNFTSLTSITGLAKLNTSKSTNMQWMFSTCRSLTSIDLSNFNTSNVTSMLAMFSNCSSLTSLDLSKFNTSNVTDMKSMFNGARSLTSLNLSNFNTSKVTDMDYMFKNTNMVSSLKLGSNFKFLSSNTTEIFLNIGTSVGSNPKTTLDCDYDQWMFFAGNVDSSRIISGHFKWLNEPAEAAMISGAEFNTAMKNLAGGNLANIKKIYFYKGTYGGYGSTLINGSKKSAPVWAKYIDGSVGIYTHASCFLADANCAGMFSDMTEITTIGNIGTALKTANVTTMETMFQNCSKLTALNLNGGSVNVFTTANVTSFGKMFIGCTALTTLDVTKFNTAKVVNWMGMFNGCGATSLNLSGFNTSKAQSMQSMFYNMPNITSLDLSSFNTSTVQVMSYMFGNCTKLKNIKLGTNFKFASTNTGMFASLGLSNSAPYTIFDCTSSQWTTITNIIGSARISYYSKK